MTATAALPPTGVLAEVLERASDPEQWERFERQLRSAGYCRHPVRLRGQVDGIDVATGEVRTIFSTADRAGRDAAEVLRQPPRGGLPVVRGGLPRRRVPARRGRPARRQGRAGVRGGASDRVRDADGAELRAGALASRRARRQGAAVPSAPRRAGVPRTGCGCRAARSTPRTIRGSASRSARTASTTSTRCCGTRWRRSCGGARRSRSRASSRA